MRKKQVLIKYLFPDIYSFAFTLLYWSKLVSLLVLLFFILLVLVLLVLVLLLLVVVSILFRGPPLLKMDHP